MQFCPACGGRVGDDFNACPSCGKNLEQARAVSRLNQGRGATKSEPLAAKESRVAQRTVTGQASTEYGMASRSSIWAQKESGRAAPPAVKARKAGTSSRTASRGSGAAVAEVEAAEAAPAVSAEESAYACYRCGSPLRYVPEYQRWYCDSCYSYV